MSEKKKTFHISDILSVSTGRLVSTRHIDGVYDVIGHLVGRDVWTTELIAYADAAKAEVCKQLVWPQEVPDPTDRDMKDVTGWVAKLEEKYGSNHTLDAPEGFGVTGHNGETLASLMGG